LDLTALVREAAEGLTVPGKQIELDVPVEMTAVADPARVRQALENLVANAVQHAPTGTAVSIRLTRDASSGTRPWMVISVNDRGPGIDPQLLPHLFDRFARSRDSNGLGIGFFLARQIADAHGGRLEVASSSADGTQFNLVLPAEPVLPSARPRHRQ
jgi:two-component system, OmpR family, sensor kinase